MIIIRISLYKARLAFAFELDVLLTREFAGSDRARKPNACTLAILRDGAGAVSTKGRGDGL
jgi:hypothetical protein